MSTISASTTSTTAYKVTADTTGTLVLQTGATPTTAVTIDASQNTTFAGTLSATSFSGSGASLTSLNATNISSGTLASARLPAGSIVQVVTFLTGSVATGTGTIPIDDTIPQITEGTEFMTLAITPTSATNRLVINVTIQLDKNNANTLTVALFQDSTANAIASQFYGALGSGISMPMSYTYNKISGTTSSTTFRVRAGSEAAGTVTMNGRGGGRIDGGVAVSSITIYEVAV